MEYSGEGVGVYAEAKGEYTRQLCQFLAPALQKFFLTLLDTAKEREPESKKLLLSFQTLLEGISEWNIDKVQRETQSLAMSTQCDYLEELLTAVFVAHTKVLSAIRLTNKQRKLQITIPKLDHFLHKTLIECARLLWTNTFLFTPSGSSMERQKNMRQIETLIMDGILQGVRVMLPVKSILREYLSTEDTDTEAEDDAEEEEAEEAEEAEEEAEEAEAEADAEAKVEAVEAETIPVEKSKEIIEKPVHINMKTATVNVTKEESIVTGMTGLEPTGHMMLEPIKVSTGPSSYDFDPSKFDIYSDVAAATIGIPSKSPHSTPKLPVETPPSQEIPTIYLDEPSRVKFSNVDSVFSDSNINETKLSENKNEVISEEIDTDVFDFEEL